MKKFLTVLLVIAIILALAAAAATGFIWYKQNHIFVEGDAYPLKAQSLDLREKDIGLAYFDQVHAQLPGCDILWNVPFQDGRISSDAREVTVKTLTDADVVLLMRYFPNLKKVSADGCTDYVQLKALEDQGLQVVYQVNLGGKSVPPDSTVLELEPQDFDLAMLNENLIYLPGLEKLTLRKCALAMEQVEELKAAHEGIEVSCTVELMGQEYDTQTTDLNLAGLTVQDVAAVAEKLAMLPGLQSVELMGADDSCELSKEDVKTLQEAAPDVAFHYAFDFYGERIATSDEEVYISSKKIGDEGIDEVRAALDLMGSQCQRFVLENCNISYDLLAQVREEYREKTNVVWRVYFGKGGSCLTDREIIKAVYGLNDDNCHDLIYCEGAKYMDLGHNEYLNTCEFVSGMPNLEAIILSGSPIKTLEPFENCKKLKFLEIAFCGYINDLTPLAGCESLEMLNVCATKVHDYSPLDELPLTLMCAKTTKSNAEEEADFIEKHPDCWTQFNKDRADEVQPYGPGWRYTEDGKGFLPYYQLLRDVFEYDKGVEAGINYTRW